MRKFITRVFAFIANVLEFKVSFQDVIGIFIVLSIVNHFFNVDDTGATSGVHLVFTLGLYVVYQFLKKRFDFKMM